MTAGTRRPRRVPRLVASSALAVLLGLAAGAAPVRASTEEFSTFDVEKTEEDDESLIDHLLLRQPGEWRDEWERAPLAFRTSEGCFTSGQWYFHHELRLETAMGRRARLGLRLDEEQDDALSYRNLELWFLFPQRVGTLGVMFRPYYDKSRQDFALSWEIGADSTANQLRLVYGLEDLFNNLWAWRQTRVGDAGESYERHPWEPAFKAALRRARWRFEAEGRWLTPSRKLAGAQYGSTFGSHRTLWGAWGAARLEARALGCEWIARTDNRQARSTDRPLDDPTGDARLSRRMWRAELGARRAVRPRLTVEGTWIYADRRQSRRSPLPDGVFRGLDRTLQLEARWAWRPDVMVRLGGLYDRITAGWMAPGGSRARNESRAYVGLTARFGRVRVAGVEGIELDPEGYEVYHNHDKGFLMLQTTF